MFVVLFFASSFIFSFSNALVCPQGWTYFGEKCWFKSTHENTWLEADSECHDRYGASLATIQSEKEASFVSKLPKHNNNGLNDFKFFDQGVSRSKDFLDCFSKTQNAALLGASVMSPSNIKTAEECIEECEKSQDRYDQICKSILWYKESKECVLNDKTKNDTDAIFVEDPEISKNIDYYEKFCEINNKSENGDDNENTILPSGKISSIPKNGFYKPKKGEITGIRSCFTKFKHSSLVGFVDKIHDNVTERECLSKCWKCDECLGKEQDPCKSVTYYPSVKQCILAKESRRNHINFFDQIEPLSIFFDRRHDCLFEMCEDLEIDLIFAIDGSAKMNYNGFNRSIYLIDQIITGIHEITEFWKISIIQIGTAGPAVIEINRKSFDTLDDFRRNLALIGWRRSPGNRLGDSLVDVADLAMKYSMEGESDFIWMISLTNGYSEDKLDDFEMLKNSKTFTSFAIGIGSDLEYINLQKIATSTNHLIHSQDMKTIVKEISTKLCSKNGFISQEKTFPPSSIPPNNKNNNEAAAAVDENPSKTKIITAATNMENNNNKNKLIISDEKDAYRNSPFLILHDETLNIFERKNQQQRHHQKNGGVKIHQQNLIVSPSTIAFMGQPRRMKTEQFKTTKLSTEDIHSIAKEFWKSSRNDSIIELDDEGKIIEDTIWIGLKRGSLGKMEWSDGSRLDEFELNLSKHLEVEMDHGDCIKQNGDMTWSQEDCTKKLIFVCNLHPIMTINEKLSKDFEKATFNQERPSSQISSELTNFDEISNNEIGSPESEINNNNSENFKASTTTLVVVEESNEKNLKVEESNLSTTTSIDSKSNKPGFSVKPKLKDSSLFQPNISNFLMPFGK